MQTNRRNDILTWVLLWGGRSIAGAWGVIFLLSISAEAANGYPPGGSAFTSAINFTSGALVLVGVALSFWRTWVGGAVLIIDWLASCLALLLGLEPQANVSMGLVVSTVVLLLPGLLMIVVGILREGSGSQPLHA